MSQDPEAGRPHGGRDDAQAGEQLAGEEPLAGEDAHVGPPSGGSSGDSASRAAQDGTMTDQSAEAPGGTGQPSPAGPPEGGTDRAGGVTGSADAASS